jgi:hypothetical protein
MDLNMVVVGKVKKQMRVQLQIMLGDKNLFELVFVLLDISLDVNLALADFLQSLLDLFWGQVLLFHLHYK